MKKLLMLLAVVSMSVFALAGCSDDSSSEGASDDNVLSIYGWVPYASADEQEIEKFEEWVGAALDCEVEVNVPTDDYQKALTTMLASGEVYDLIYVHQDYYLELVEQGALMDLTPYIEGSETLSNPEVLNPEKYTEPLTVDGKVYALPTKDEGGFVPMVRQDWLDEWGMEVPDSLEEWEAYWEMCKTEKDAYGISLYGLNWIQPFMSAFGLYEGVVENEDGTYTVPYASDEAVEAWTWWADMYAKGYITPDFQTMAEVDARNMLLSGESGTTIYYSHWAQTFNDRAAENPETPEGYLVSPAPAVPDETGNATLSNAPLSLLAVPANADSPELAIEFMELWYSPEGCMVGTFGYEGYDYTLDESGTVTMTELGTSHKLNHAAADPVNESWEKPVGYDSPYQPQQDTAEVYLDETARSVEMPSNWQDVNNIITKYGAAAIKGEMSPEEAVETMQSEIEALSTSELTFAF